MVVKITFGAEIAGVNSKQKGNSCALKARKVWDFVVFLLRIFNFHVRNKKIRIKNNSSCGWFQNGKNESCDLIVGYTRNE